MEKKVRLINTPTGVAIVTGVVTLMIAVLGHLYSIYAEHQKSIMALSQEDRKFKTYLIMTAMDSPKESVRIQNLQFLVKVGLIDTDTARIMSLKTKDVDIVNISEKIESHSDNAKEYRNIAKEYYEIGESYLVKRNIDSASKYFALSDNLYPEYKCAYEIKTF